MRSMCLGAQLFCTLAVTALTLPAEAQPVNAFLMQSYITRTQVNNQLVVHLGQLTGPDVLLPGFSVLSGSLNSSDAWRREAALVYTLPGTHGFDGSISFSAFDSSQPSPFLGLSHGFGGHFGFWQRDSVGTMVFDFRENGWHITSGLSVSDYFGIRDLFSRSAQHLEGTSAWQSITFTPWSTGSDHLRLHLTYGSTPSGYRSFDPFLASPLFYNGRTIDLGVDYKAGGYGLVASYQSSGDQELWINKTDAKITFPSVELSVSHGSWGYAFSTTDTNVYDVWSRQSYTKSAVKISLPHVPLGSLGFLSPTYVKLQWQHYETLSQGEALPEMKSLAGVGLGWSTAHATTEISLSRASVRGYVEQGAYGSGVDTVIEFLQTYDQDHWGMSGYLDIDNARKGSPKGTSFDGFLAGGVSLTLRSPRYPNIQLGIDYNSYLSIIPGFESNFRSNGVSFHLSMDFSKFLPAVLRKRRAFLILKAFTDFSVDQSVVNSVRLGQVAFLTFGTHF